MKLLKPWSDWTSAGQSFLLEIDAKGHPVVALIRAEDESNFNRSYGGLCYIDNKSFSSHYNLNILKNAIEVHLNQLGYTVLDERQNNLL